MQDMTPLQITAVYHMQLAINNEKEKAYKNAQNGKNRTYTIDEYRKRVTGKDLYVEKATPAQCDNWKRIKEQFQQNR